MKPFNIAILACTILAAVAITRHSSAADTATTQPLDQAELFHLWNGGLCMGAAPPKKEWLAAIAARGFNSIELTIALPAHAAADKPYTIDPAFLKPWLEMLDQANATHLHVLLSVMPYEALTKDPDANADRFVALWEQLAKSLQSYPATLAFELYQEPNGKLDAAHWNKLLAQTVAAIRQTNPDRLLLIGPARYYNDFEHLQLPDDPHLAIAFHSWLPGKDVWQGTDAQQKAITKLLDRVVGWGQKFKHPVFLTEFGKNVGNGDVESHLRWVATVARAAEARNIPWIYSRWAGGSFAPYDLKTTQWQAPVMQALLPATSSPTAAPASRPSEGPSTQLPLRTHSPSR